MTSCLTWMVKGVSFFLLMVLSSMVSGTDRLIILLTGDKPNHFMTTLMNLRCTVLQVLWGRDHFSDFLFVWKLPPPHFVYK